MCFWPRLLLLAAPAAMADSKWTCTWNWPEDAPAISAGLAMPNVETYAIVGNVMTSPSEDAFWASFGVPGNFAQTRWTVLQDTSDGIVAVLSDGLGVAWVDTILIDKRTGTMRRLIASATTADTTKEHAGTCVQG